MVNKALSLWQPWASLIIDGRKNVETRSWSTSYRGVIAIHASMKVDKKACIDFGYEPRTIATGCVIGTARLVDCVQFPNPSIVPDAYGDFTDGRYGWVLGSIVRFKEPVPAKGSLGLWDWEVDSKKK